MTEEQKEILIAKMLDAPASLSDMELDAISDDDELRDIYAASAALDSAYAAEQEFDMDAEWKRFSPRLHRKPDKMRWFMRVAAIFLGVIFASSIVVKIINTIFTHAPQPVIAKVEQVSKAAERPTLHMPEQMSMTETKTPRNHAVDHDSKHYNTRHIAKAEVSMPAATRRRQSRRLMLMSTCAYSRRVSTTKWPCRWPNHIWKNMTGLCRYSTLPACTVLKWTMK